MSNCIIEVQRSNGNWVQVSSTINLPQYINKALREACKYNNAKKSRARDSNNGSLIDVYQE